MFDTKLTDPDVTFVHHMYADVYCSWIEVYTEETGETQQISTSNRTEAEEKVGDLMKQLRLAVVTPAGSQTGLTAYAKVWAHIQWSALESYDTPVEESAYVRIRVKPKIIWYGYNSLPSIGQEFNVEFDVTNDGEESPEAYITLSMSHGLKCVGNGECGGYIVTYFLPKNRGVALSQGEYIPTNFAQKQGGCTRLDDTLS